MLECVFVLTADQIGSSVGEDLASTAVEELNARYGAQLSLPVDRNAGDEIQVLSDNPSVALAIILQLTRTEQWSVGCGIGPVRTPLPRNTREAAGPAFTAARDAVTRAKSAPRRFALAIAGGQLLSEHEVAPLIDLMLLLRSRRTPEGWQLFDLLSEGLTQTEAAARLEITPQAVSKRAQAAAIRAEFDATPALARLLADADRIADEETSRHAAL